VEYGKSVFIPSQGWAVFGQLGNNLTKAQLLPTVDGEWTEGPELMSSQAHMEKQCMFQVKKVFGTFFLHTYGFLIGGLCGSTNLLYVGKGVMV